MSATVYFATNRVISGSPDDYRNYGAALVPPTDFGAVTYGTAFVKDADLTADAVGAIQSIQEVSKGDFNAATKADLSAPGRNLLVFIHGFANSFENAITRAAFNQQWLKDSGVAGANTTVIAFTWPSLGRVLSLPIPFEDYCRDQDNADQSGVQLMRFFQNLQPVIAQARASGRKVFLLAHSMGHMALKSGVESWFRHGNGAANLFDEAFLCAADERFTTFSNPMPGRLSALKQLAKHISIYYSTRDQVLHLSQDLNFMRRLGERGPADATNTVLFAPDRYRIVDCSGFSDYDFGFQDSHQYYRRSKLARGHITDVM